LAADDDEYEILPRQEIETLKKELERLRKNPFGETKEGENILDAINNLNNNIRRLIDIFTKAGADLEKDYGDVNGPIGALNDIKDQNEQIAQGVLAVADMVKDVRTDIAQSAMRQSLSSEPRMPVNRSSSPDPLMGQTSFSSLPESAPLPDDFPGPIPPPPQPFLGMEDQPLPNNPFMAPPGPGRKRSLFGRR
jgi:hypothetical protein